MQCPNCQSKTISFRQWCRGKNAFSWTCPHCLTALQANKATRRAAVLTIPLVLISVAVIIYLRGQDIIASDNARIYLLGALLLACLPTTYLYFKKLVGYEVKPE